MQKIIYSCLLLLLFFVQAKAQNIDYTLLKQINSSYTERGGKVQSVITNSVTPIMIAVPAGILAYSLFKKDSITRQKFYTIASSE